VLVVHESVRGSICGDYGVDRNGVELDEVEERCAWALWRSGRVWKWLGEDIQSMTNLSNYTNFFYFNGL